MGAPSEITDLIRRFREQYDSYRLPSYGETQLRREFVDPFFKSLGWDIDNNQGYAEVHENRLVNQGSRLFLPYRRYEVGLHVDKICL